MKFLQSLVLIGFLILITGDKITFDDVIYTSYGVVIKINSVPQQNGHPWSGSQRHRYVIPWESVFYFTEESDAPMLKPDLGTCGNMRVE